LLNTFASGDDIRIVTRDGQPGLRIAFPYLYNQGEIILRAQARLFLARLGKDCAPLLPTYQIRVEAFTRTRVPTHYGPALELAFGRASAVARQLVDEGNVPTTRVTTTIRGDISAETPLAPTSPHHNPERIEIYLDPAPETAAETAAPAGQAPASQDNSAPPASGDVAPGSAPLLVPPTLPSVPGAGTDAVDTDKSLSGTEARPATNSAPLPPAASSPAAPEPAPEASAPGIDPQRDSATPSSSPSVPAQTKPQPPRGPSSPYPEDGA
jgi:hypothetical protein